MEINFAMPESSTMAFIAGGSSSAARERKWQNQELEKWFDLGSKPNQDTKQEISASLGITVKQVDVWFQNKRAREKTKNLRKEYQQAVEELEIVMAKNDMLRANIHQMMIFRTHHFPTAAVVAPAAPPPPFGGIAGDQVPGMSFWG